MKIHVSECPLFWTRSFGGRAICGWLSSFPIRDFNICPRHQSVTARTARGDRGQNDQDGSRNEWICILQRKIINSRYFKKILFSGNAA